MPAFQQIGALSELWATPRPIENGSVLVLPTFTTRVTLAHGTEKPPQGSTQRRNSRAKERVRHAHARWDTFFIPDGLDARDSIPHSKALAASLWASRGVVPRFNA